MRWLWVALLVTVAVDRASNTRAHTVCVCDMAPPTHP